MNKSHNKKTLLLRSGVCLFFIILLCKLLYDERDTLYHYYARYGEKDYAAVTSSSEITKNILLFKKTLTQKNIVFVDIGCGNGLLIKKIAHDFYNCKGIELDKDIANTAKTHTHGISNVEIINCDMCDYKFQDQPSIIFLYEPLWQLEGKEAKNIYKKFIMNIKNSFKINSPYILYVNGMRSRHMDKDFLSNQGLDVLKIIGVGSSLLRKKLYICQYIIPHSINPDPVNTSDIGCCE